MKKDLPELKNIAENFNLGMLEKTNNQVKARTTVKENADISLPPLLVEAFKRGLEEGKTSCDCGCDKDHDCAASAAGHHCGRCNHDHG